ncbi:MAG TPA: carboxy-S-adenosyl-L-methionine synthase CmoA [Oligoflexia bacterium]|nr:carboxy-S-adenosyl-L-methionine synthase CmoA [Oligoflexia bacterium]HMP48100.1 carboxy-S-adenosyl-L-methionine synthase CmoA [Oligoflexia bacterium]
MNSDHDKRDIIFRDDAFSDGDFPKSPEGDTRFAFNAKVAAVFDDMVSRSIPAYPEVQEMSARLSTIFVVDNSSIFDLGCSTGTSIIKIAQALTEFDKRNISIYGVDSSLDMLERCKEKISAFSLENKISLLSDDLRQLKITNASLVIAHYTLQFLPPSTRPAILKSIYDGMLSGGAFIFSEKVHHNNDTLEEFIVSSYYDFKKDNGYSDQENFRKRQALENVLLTHSLEENISLLHQAGFDSVEILNKTMCFTTIVAVK